MFICKTKNLCLYLLVFAAAVSCDNNKLPKVDYAEEVDERYIPIIINYHDRNLRVKDSIIEEFKDFQWSYVANQPGFEYNLRHCLLALSVDRNTPFVEIDSLLRVLDQNRFYRVFFLVNDIKDTLGFTMSIPGYSLTYPESFQISDTLLLDNLIELKENLVYINGKHAVGMEIDYKIKEMVFKKEQVALVIDKVAKYESLIKILSNYHKCRQHSKELYAELKFNKEYSWFYELPRYFSRFKYDVDEEYRSKIFLLDTSRFSDRTILVDNEYTINYAP